MGSCIWIPNNLFKIERKLNKVIRLSILDFYYLKKCTIILTKNELFYNFFIDLKQYDYFLN